MSAPKSATEMPTRGIEPRTSGLQDLRSTTELYGLVLAGHARKAKFDIYIHHYLPTDGVWSLRCQAHRFERTPVELHQLPHMRTTAESS